MSRTPATTGDPTVKLSVSVPGSLKAFLDAENGGGNLSQYVTAVLDKHRDTQLRERMRAGSALLAEDLAGDAPDGDYLEMMRRMTPRAR